MHLTTTLDLDNLIADIATLRGLQQAGRYPEALHHARQLLFAYPGNRDLLLIEASSLRTLGHTEEALASCARLEAVAPHFSLMHQERGFCHVLRHDAPSAIAALSVAVRINPALPQSWRMLEAVYRIIGDTANATFAARQQDALKALPDPLIEGMSLFSDGDLERAEKTVKTYMRAEGYHPEAPRLLAKISRKRGNSRAARRYLAEVLTLSPDHRAARLEYVEALVSCRRDAEAEAVLAPLLNTADSDDDEAAFRISAQRAVIAMSAGRYDEVIAICRGLLDQAQPFSDQAAWTRISMLLADALRTIGDVAAAIAAYRAVIDARSDYGYAYWCLADLKTYRFSDADIAQMRAALAAETTSATDRIGLSFALGKAMEDRKDPEAAWFFYNAHRGQSLFSPDHDAAEAIAIKRAYSPAFFAQRRDWGDDGADPIFVVGLTRGGSSLIEQILASHPQVEGLGELPNIPAMLEDLQPDGPDPDRIARLTASEARELGQRYLAETRISRVTDRPRFVDKLPRNFRNIGFIHLILPHARIIDARRSPMACCFSNFRQLFGVAHHLDNGHSNSYNLEGVGRVYRIYLDLMKHWQATLPDKVMLMIHEDLVADPESQIRRLLDACDLPFANECLAFHQNRRAVRTPSAQQVRQPINRDGVDGWRAFEAWLDPLKLTLGDALQTWRD
ncbi:MAG: tetratricopeptide repeat-containing sulfotransferase family protein [Asticcacaulis sp.]|uniref:tetratricopeptide repeat-containing sulfotransferase family protein n=1 Tax=Asticcacaulis sp. TaxID=1872648 RepID=UPI003F7B4BAD